MADPFPDRGSLAPGFGTDAPVGTERVRLANTGLLLRALREAGPLTRAELAKTTGLAKGTVSTIVAGLQGSGAVAESPAVTTATPAARGRPGTPVRLDGAGLVGLGVEVNVDYAAAVAVDLAGREIFSRERVGATGPQELRRFVAECWSALTDRGARVLGVTVAVPGLVDRSRGRVVAAPNLGWADLDVAGLLASAVGPGCPVRVDNDANCAALAETVRGVAVGCRDILYVTGTVGVGGGVVSGGEVLRGARGYAGEVGHMRVGSSRAVCSCGRTGCWEAQVGMRAMLVAVGLPDTGDRDPAAVGAQVATLATGRGGESASVRQGLRRVGTALAAGTAMLAEVLDPALIVLGGYFVPLGPWVLPPVRDALARDVFAAGGAQVALSTLGLRAAAAGGALEVLEDVFHARIAL